jgi:translocation and assembly module TamB
MVTKQKKKHRLVRGLLWLMGVGIFLLVLLPVWFPWVLKPVASRYGIGFAHYERIGWNRFAVSGVHGEWGGTRLDVQRVESVLPTTWLWRRFNGNTNSPQLLTLSDGHLFIGSATTNTVTTASAEQHGSAGVTLNLISQIGHTLQRILPVAELTNCMIEFASTRLSIPHADWRTGRLHGVVRIPSTSEEIELAVQLDGDSAMKLSADWGDYDAAFHGEFSRIADGWRWNGELGWLTNRTDFTAQFTTNSWWPSQAQAEFPHWQIPAKPFHVEGYENFVANLTANLVSNRFDLQATGFARPTDASAQSGWPVVNFSLGADGDPSGVRLHALNIQSPWLNADLTNTVCITRSGELLAEPAQLRVSIDLAKLPGTNLTGKAEGFVQIEPQSGRSPVARFHFSAVQVSAGDLDAKTILVRGEFAPPILKLDEIRADLADGSVLVADGSFDGATRSIVGGHWKLSGGFLHTFLPRLSYSGFAASGELNGPLTNLAHSGEVTFTNFQAAGLKPLDVHAKWSGANQHLETADIELKAGESTLTIGAAADFGLAKCEVAATLNRLTLRRGDEDIYKLQQPSAIAFRAGNTNAPGGLWTLSVNAFNWRSERHAMSASADLAWPAHGEATLSITNVAFADFLDFVEADIANVLVADLNATAHWSNGPVQSVISIAGSITNITGQVFGLRGAVQADEQLKIDLSALASGYAPTLVVTGTVPVKFIPERSEGMFAWDKSQKIALAGNWKDDQSEEFSIPLGKPGRLDVSRPELNFQISGTPDEPFADLTAGAAKFVWQPKTNNSPRPTMGDFQLAMEIRPDAIRLKTFAAKLDGQPITATGEWPLVKKAWGELWSTGKLPDWNQARGHLELKEAQVAAVSVYLPEMLAPEGQVTATLDLKTGKGFEGVLTLTNAATRPMGAITPLRDIAALVRLNGNRAVLEDFRGQIGGQPIRADGFVTIPELDGSGLDYHVNLHGTNVPIARSAELLLRGDFDVSLRGGSNQPSLLSGTIALRDGLYVQHASAFVWSSPKRPGMRPPYFSVTNEPFADWKLELAVSGDKFLRVRTPVFSGIISSDFQLRGSLLAPVLTGDARVNSGRMIFPFGSLTIDQGLASFTGNDLRGPDLLINASGRNYRYDLRVEVKGRADGANVIFSSTPPLASEQILLMLTAGEIPESDYAYSNGARAGRLVTFLGKDLLSSYFGSDPDKERLIIQTGESVSQTGGLTYSVEYRFTDRWSIIGEYDEFNAFNTDLKWKVFTR